MNHPKDLTLRQCKVIWFNGHVYLCMQQAGLTLRGLVRRKIALTLGLCPSAKVWPAVSDWLSLRKSWRCEKKKPHCSEDSYWLWLRIFGIMMIISTSTHADPSMLPQLQQFKRKIRNRLQIIKILYSSLLLVKSAQRGRNNKRCV